MNKKFPSVMASLVTALILGGQAYAAETTTTTPSVDTTALTSTPATAPAVTKPVNHQVTKHASMAHKKAMMHKKLKVSKKSSHRKKTMHKKTSMHKNTAHQLLTDPHASTKTGTQMPKK